MSLAEQRALFEVPEDLVYLNCAYMSPLLREARIAGERAVSRKSRPWTIESKDFFEEAEIARQLVARLLDGDADGVAIVPSASYGLAVAAANLPVQPGQRILVLEEEFPSNVYAWQDLARRSQATLVSVPRPADYDWTRALLEHIDERTAIVAVSHCSWTDGTLIDLSRVSERTHAVNATLVVDATQSLGAYPLSVAQIQPDVVVAAAYKWLLGPYGLAFLYMSPSHRAGRPIEFSWITRQDSEDFAGLTSYRDAYQPGARRYDMGERSNFILLPIAITALQQILAWRVEAIAETLQELTNLAEEEARKHGWQTIPSARRVGHLIGIQTHGTLPADLVGQLARRQVYISMRGRTIRLSPHLYNTAHDIYRCFEALADLV